MIGVQVRIAPLHSPRRRVPDKLLGLLGEQLADIHPLDPAAGDLAAEEAGEEFIERSGAEIAAGPQMGRRPW